jgi:translation initiation factor IF-1
MQVVEVLKNFMLEAMLKPNHKYTAHVTEEAK